MQTDVFLVQTVLEPRVMEQPLASAHPLWRSPLQHRYMGYCMHEVMSASAGS